jgi:hypothetical protein
LPTNGYYAGLAPVVGVSREFHHRAASPVNNAPCEHLDGIGYLTKKQCRFSD